MKNITLNYASKEDVKDTVEHVAEHIRTHALCINQSYYLITEFEFYIKTKDKDIHHDEYTYSHERQKTKGQLYLHASGLDMTIGDESTYAGVLLRGAIKLSSIDNPTKNEILNYTNGPINLADEIVHQIDLMNGTTIAFKPMNVDNLSLEYTRGRRIGLKKGKFSGYEEYINRNLRFLSILSSEVMQRIDTNRKLRIMKIDPGQD